MSRSTRLLVIGAGGRTGSLLCALATRQGHSVTALSRQPLGPEAAADRNVVGDARDPATVAEALQDQDAVITTVAAHGRGPTTTVSDITRTVLSQMSSAAVNRIVVTSSRNLTATRPRIAVAATKWIFRHVYADLAQAEELVRTSTTDWSIVRAVMLTDDPARGSVHRDHAADATGGDWRLSRADYAQALLDIAVDPDATRQEFGVNGAK